MSVQSKAARAAMKDKAKRLASESASRVDASDYRIPTDMHAEAKTGMRPVSKKAFKRGGAVQGDRAPERADRRPRAAGGKLANELVNRNVKDANEDRPGIKHDGGMARGGRPKRMAPSEDAPRRMSGAAASREADDAAVLASLVKRAPKVSRDDIMPPGGSKYRVRGDDDGLKRGGRAAKADGGEMVDPRALAAMRIKAAADRAGVAPNRFNFTTTKPGVMASAAGLKKGGAVEGSAKDKREDKAMARAHGMTMAEWEKSAADKKHDRPKRANGGKQDNDQFPPERGDDRPPMPARDGSNASANGPQRPVIDLSSKLGKYAKGGAAHAASCKCKECGGRVARATGGRTKSGKTNVNIIIATGQKPQGGDALPPSMQGRPPMGMPIPAPAPPPGGMPGGPPMGMPMPMPPPGGMPMPRARGGRTYRSYKDMDAGALSGQGRLEKTEIQARKR